MQQRQGRWTFRGKFAAAAAWAALLIAPATAQNADELVSATHTENQAMQAQQTYKEVNSPGLRNVVEQLVTVDLSTGQLAPMLATEWEQIDGKTWRFTLREGVTFHDGSPFNAEAAAFAVNWVWSPENSFHIRETWGRRSRPRLLANTSSR